MISPELLRELTEVLSRHIAPAILREVDAVEDKDSDEEDVLRLRFVYDEAAGSLTDEKVFEASGLVAEVLDRNEETRFPLITFISKDDFEAAA